MCVLTVCIESTSSLPISAADRLLGQIAQHPQLGLAQRLGRARALSGDASR